MKILVLLVIQNFVRIVNLREECKGSLNMLLCADLTYRKSNVQYMEGKGFGLLAAENIRAGDFVIEYIGEVCVLLVLFTMSQLCRSLMMRNVEIDWKNVKKMAR